MTVRVIAQVQDALTQAIEAERAVAAGVLSLRMAEKDKEIAALKQAVLSEVAP